MPIVPIRDIGSLGVNTDIDAYSLPTQAFSSGFNARFENKIITRGPISKTAGVLVNNTSPKYAISYAQLAGTTKFFLCNLDGTVTDWSVSGYSGVSSEVNISIPGYTPVTTTSPFTGTQINDLVYLNRPDRVPWYIAKTGGTQFQALPVWDSTWRCQAFRSVAGVLVAINVTKGATSYPTMVKTSDYMTFGSYPGTWTADPTNSATENIIPDLKEPLIDGCVLRDRMILYTNNETWLMQPTFDTFVFSYSKLFTNAGIVNQNCVTERNNTHYVFGMDDLWLHDGFQRKTIATGMIRNFVFQNLVRNQSSQCFVAHHPRLNEILFCYPSSDSYCNFPVGGAVGYPGCNRAAVYNYFSGLWYFYDLPYVTFATLGNAVAGATWADLSGTTWSSLDASWSTLGDSAPLTLLTLGLGGSGAFGTLQPAVRTFDIPNSPYSLGNTDLIASAPVYLENQGLDFDNLGVNLTQYKVIKTVYPEARFDSGSQPLIFSFGSTDYANAPPPAYGTPMSYDGYTNYKLDYLCAGRYLSIKITYNDVKNFSLNGFDFDVLVTGSR